MVKKKVAAMPKKKSGGATSMMKKQAGGATATKKKMIGGGGTKQCKEGDPDPGCQTVRKGNIFQRLGDVLRNKRASNFGKKKLVRTKYRS